MKIFTEKGIFKKLIIIVLAIMFFNAIIPTNVSYAVKVADIEKLGGPLIKPIVDLMLAIGDICMDLIHSIVYDMETSVVRIDKDIGLIQVLGIIGAAVFAFVLIGFATGGLTALAVHFLQNIVEVGITLSGIASIVTISLSGAVAAGFFARSNWFSDEFVMPLYRITPEEIFSGKINFLNVNFFKDEEYEEDELNKILKLDTYTNLYNNDEYLETLDDGIHSTGYTEQKALEEINKELRNYGYSGEEILEIKEFPIRWEYTVNDEIKAREAVLNINIDVQIDTMTGRTVNTIHRELTINEGKWAYTKHATLGTQLKPTVTKWYYAVRNFSLIAMMVILLYIGIRIMLCGVSSQKAKYKNMLIDWIVAVCLIFVMHYIMVFAMNVVDSLIKIFGSVNQSQEYFIYYEGDSKIINALKDENIDVDAITREIKGKKYVMWDAKNIVGFARVQAALNNAGNFKYVGWVMCYCVLVCYTVFFVFTYLKRAIYLAFFTVIAPLVAMTYPIDKIHDGKAQAFDMWLKEYIFNLMIQPVHLLLYTVLISSAFDLASTNILYTLVAIGFMMHAEKLLRKMFGFGKAETPGMLSGAAGTAIMMSTIDKLIPKKAKKEDGSKEKKEKEKEKGKDEDEDEGKIDLKEIFDDLESGTQGGRLGKLGKGLGKAGNKLGDSKYFDMGNISKNFDKKVKKFSRNIADGKPVRSMARTMKRVYFGAAGAMVGAAISLADDKPVESLKKNIPVLYKAGDAYGSRK